MPRRSSRAISGRSGCPIWSWWPPTWARPRWHAGSPNGLSASFAIIDKRRPFANVSEVLNVVGDVEGRTCLITDDMIGHRGHHRAGGHRAEGTGGQARLRRGHACPSVGRGRLKALGFAAVGTRGDQHDRHPAREALRPTDGGFRWRICFRGPSPTSTPTHRVSQLFELTNQYGPPKVVRG